MDENREIKREAEKKERKEGREEKKRKAELGTKGDN